MRDLRDRIIRVAECFTNKMSDNTWRETEYRLYVCHATDGAHVENY